VLEAPGRLAARIDRRRVAQVIANVLANAIKYTSGGEIRVVLRRQSNTARLSIRDQGNGIPADSLNRIFEPRIRLNAKPGATRRGPNSAGLGLSIARDIVEAHGGRIWADSPPGQGASFTVVLPLDAATASGGGDALGVVEKLVTKTTPRPKTRARRGSR
jgi:signal transduction histidine kinase